MQIGEQSFKDVDGKSWRTKNVPFSLFQTKYVSNKQKYNFNTEIILIFYLSNPVILYVSSFCEEVYIRNPNTRWIFVESNVPRIRYSDILGKLARRCMPRNSTLMKRDIQRIMKSVTPLGCSHFAIVVPRSHSCVSLSVQRRERTLRTHVHPMSLIFQGYRTARRCVAGSMHFARATRVCTVMLRSANLHRVPLIHDKLVATVSLLSISSDTDDLRSKLLNFLFEGEDIIYFVL